jgi:hypothetical protein
MIKTIQRTLHDTSTLHTENYYTNDFILSKPNHEAPHAIFCSHLLLLLMFIQTFICLYKHLVCCEGTVVGVKLPEDGVNKRR